MVFNFLSKFLKNDFKDQSHADHLDILRDLWTGIDPDKIGMGNDPNSKVQVMEWPTAYSLLLSSLLKRSGSLAFTKSFPNKDVDNMVTCVSDWLIKNQVCSSTAMPVWGLPYRRKIWIDEQSTKPNTGFNVPTVHGIHAMLDLAEHSKKMREIASKSAFVAASAWHSECSSLIGGERTYWYSTLENHSFHVTNAISLMAGSIQRAASRFPNIDNKLIDGADQAILYILNSRRMDLALPTWDYFGSRMPPNKMNRNNDLLHEAFVCDGLLTYKKYGGNLGSRVDPKDLFEMLAKFKRGKIIYDFPITEKNQNRRKNPARAIGLAHALFVVCEIYKLSPSKDAYELAHSFFREINNNILEQGKIRYRNLDTDISSYIRTRAHLIYAISNYIDLVETETALQ